MRALFSATFLCAVLGLRPAAADAPPPRFQPATCPFTLGSGLVDGVDVRCGYLLVPENRQQPATAMIRLAVADFKSGTADPDPLIYLQGGPGGGSVATIGPAVTKATIARIAGGHDLILVDQRGAGLSQPSLSCPEVVTAQRGLLRRPLLQAAQVDTIARAAGQCHDRLARAGVNLAAYTTEAAAADIAALGPALGYQQVDLYGVSYGTRLALTTMRLFPTGIRGVILDGVLPPQVDLFMQYPVSMAHAFSVLVAGCDASLACNHAYPHLDREFVSRVGHLNARPATVSLDDGSGAVVLTGDLLARLVINALYTTSSIPAIPYLINSVFHGRYGVIAAIYAGLDTATDDALHLGAYYSVECGEDSPFTTPAGIATAARALPTQLRAGVLDDPQSGLIGAAACRRWTVPTVDVAQKMAVSSAIPTLILTGEYDPITPSSLGALAARTLSRSFVFTYPGLGHGSFLLNPCATTMAEEFLADPTHSPDATCMTSMREPRFITP